jgi:hypothetical protein
MRLTTRFRIFALVSDPELQAPAPKMRRPFGRRWGGGVAEIMLKVGTSYRSKSGKKFTIVFEYPNGVFVGVYVDSIRSSYDSTLHFNSTGAYHYGSSGDVSGLDLIAEWVEPEILETFAHIKNVRLAYPLELDIEPMGNKFSEMEQVGRMFEKFVGKDVKIKIEEIIQ